MRNLGFAFIVALGLAFGGGVSPASAQVLPSIVLDPSTVEVGGTFTVRLTGFVCDPREDVELRIVNDLQQNVAPPDSLFPVSDAGSLVQPLTAPSTPGTYDIVAVFDNGDCPEEQATLTVVPRDTTPSSTITTTTTTTTIAATTTTVAGQVAPSTAATTTTAAPVTLPATGRSTDGLVWIALALSLLGGGLVTLAARRS